MEQRVECTHCKVLMTGWSAAGSPITYWQCPFCSRTHSSLYGEVFRTAAGARLVERATAEPDAREPGAHVLPQRTRDEIRWAGVRANAKRWFARLEQEEARPGAGLRPEGAAHPEHPSHPEAAPHPPTAAPRATAAVRRPVQLAAPAAASGTRRVR